MLEAAKSICWFFVSLRSASRRRRAVAFSLLIVACVVAHSAGAIVAAEPAATKQSTADRPATDSLGDPLPAGALLRLGTTRFHAPSSNYEMTLSPDEKTVVTVGHQLMVWDTKTGKELWRADPNKHGLSLSAASYGTRAIVFTADSQHFYTPRSTIGVTRWNVATGENESVSIFGNKVANNTRPQFGHDQMSKAVDLSPDGKTLVIGNAFGVIASDIDGDVLFEIVNTPGPAGDMNRDRLWFGGHYSLVRFSPDGKLLAAVLSESPNEIRLLDSQKGTESRRIALKAKLVRLAFSPDSKQIAATERDNAVRLYAVDAVETANKIWSHIVPLKNRGENYTSAIAYSPNGKLLAVGATDSHIHLLDAATGNETGDLSAELWYPWALAFTADSKTLYSTGWDGGVSRWDVAARKLLPLPVGIRATSVCAASPDGQTLAFEDELGSIRLVNAADGAERTKLDKPGTGYSCFLFSPDSQTLAGGGQSGDNVHVTIWDLGSKKFVHRWEWAKGADKHSDIECFSFTPDGQRLAAASFRHHAAFIWDLPTDKQIARLKHSEVYGLSFSPDGQTLATAGWDQKVRFWDASTGKLRMESAVRDDAAQDANFNQSDTRMYTVCYSPSGDVLATAQLDGKVRIWNAANMSPLREFKLKGRFIYGTLAFSPDGAWLATGAQNGDVSLWDPSTGAQVWDVGRHQGNVQAISFGRDSRTLLTGGDDGVDYLWNLRPRTTTEFKNTAEAWDALSGEESSVAYQAMWHLRDEPEKAVPLVAAKLRLVSQVFDADRAATNLTVAEVEEIKQLERLVAAKNPTVARAAAARRAIALLAELATPAVLEVLQELAQDSPSAEIREQAAAAIGRAKSLSATQK